jgi:hypothetical protein
LKQITDYTFHSTKGIRATAKAYRQNDRIADAQIICSKYSAARLHFAVQQLFRNFRDVVNQAVHFGRTIEQRGQAVEHFGALNDG